MPEIKEIGVVIASREMTLRFDDGKKEKLTLKVGMPFEFGENYDWCCPYELCSETSKRLRGMFGIDALQALQLTMKTLKAELDSWEISSKGKIYFLDHEGHGF